MEETTQKFLPIKKADIRDEECKVSEASWFLVNPCLPGGTLPHLWAGKTGEQDDPARPLPRVPLWQNLHVLDRRERQRSIPWLPHFHHLLWKSWRILGLVRSKGQPEQGGNKHKQNMVPKMLPMSSQVSKAPETSFLLGVHQFDFSAVVEDKCNPEAPVRESSILRQFSL